MRISIIIPALNEADGIAHCLTRALAANPHEVIVVDGGSSDATCEIAGQFDCQVLRSRPGRARQQNHGAQQASGEVLLFLHADSWLASVGLQEIRHALANPRIEFGAFQHCIEARGLIYRLIERGDTLRARILRMAYGDQGIFVRRALFDQLGGFPVVGLMEDVLLVRKLRRFSPLVVLPGPLHTSARRWGKYGPVRQTLRNWSLLLAEALGVHPDILARYY